MERSSGSEPGPWLMTSKSWTGGGSGVSMKGGNSRSLYRESCPGLCLAPLVCMAFCGFGARSLAIAGRGKKKPLRFEHRRGGSLISDQSPRGACSDETMTTAAEETAALAANEAVPERIIDAGRESVPGCPVKPKREAQPLCALE